MIESELPALVIGKDFPERRFVLEKPIFGGGMSINVAGVRYVVGCANAGIAGTFGGVGGDILDKTEI